MFSDVGPDIRWVGNESGIAGDPCWNAFDTDCFVPGEADTAQLNSGHRNGRHWLPAECDVSIRPGWFYHAEEDERVRTPDNLLDLYFQSVGRGASLHLNLPPDQRGQVHERDVASLRGFHDHLTRLFSRDLAHDARITASQVRGAGSAYVPGNLVDGKPDTYWATDDGVTQAEFELTLDGSATFNVISLREYLPLGQRVEGFRVLVDRGGQWQEIAAGTGIGNRRLVRVPVCTTRRVKVEVQGPVCPALTEFGLFHDAG